jgi:hypothetical protein
LLGLVLTGCGGGDSGGDSYPSEVVDNFMSSCTAGGLSESQCRCTIDEIQAAIPFEDYENQEGLLSAGTPSEEFVQAMANAAMECISE